MVTRRGIEANSDQIRAILSIPSLTCIKDVQWLVGWVAALSRFISRSANNCHLFFHALKKSKMFKSIASCKEALQQLKRYLTSLSLISKPVDREKLYSYLVVSETAISAVLVREEETKQLPFYYVNKSLLDMETQYSQLEKLALALIPTSKKLRPYFSCHSIVPHITVKSQALADFIVDFTPSTTTQAESELLCMNGGSPSKWTVLVDGSSNTNGSGFGLVLIAPKGDIIQRAIRCGFKCTNNEAKYEALIAGLSLAKEIGAKRLEAQFDEFSIVQILRVENSYANALANLGSALKRSSQSSILLLFMQWPANWKEQQPNKPLEEAMGVELADCWMTSIVRYLEHDELPADKNEARRLKARATRFTIHEGQLLRKSFSGPYLKCINPEEAQSVLVELHEGECGNHAAGRSLAHRVITAGYYWPTIRTNLVAYVKKCDSY
ncbi:uncharacterized protein LOC116125179 [Pistacia vera]|uniref:uncharacterized protein LOC116125179 n=1 Tax=Pistacia vera TaxID=55513 RepID=UPI001263E0D5|nr:uncharacterized protein LOC116125179 [Pistacia vera]